LPHTTHTLPLPAALPIYESNQPHQDADRRPILLVIPAYAARRNEIQQRLPFLGIDVAHGLFDNGGKRARKRLLRLQWRNARAQADRKSTRLNSSHVAISY